MSNLRRDPFGSKFGQPTRGDMTESLAEVLRIYDRSDLDDSDFIEAIQGELSKWRTWVDMADLSRLGDDYDGHRAHADRLHDLQLRDDFEVAA